MSDLYPVAGAKIYIGGVLASKTADFIASDFTSQTWTAIDGWETMGAIGDTAESITTNLINRGRVTKQKARLTLAKRKTTSPFCRPMWAKLR